MKVQWTVIFALIFALLVAIFAVVNVNTVSVNFAFTKAEVPLIIVILVSTLLGGLIVGLFGIIRQYRLQRQIKQLTARLNAGGEPASPDPDTEEPGEARQMTAND